MIIKKLFFIGITFVVALIVYSSSVTHARGPTVLYVEPQNGCYGEGSNSHIYLIWDTVPQAQSYMITWKDSSNNARLVKVHVGSGKVESTDPKVIYKVDDTKGQTLKIPVSPTHSYTWQVIAFDGEGKNLGGSTASPGPGFSCEKLQYQYLEGMAVDPPSGGVCYPAPNGGKNVYLMWLPISGAAYYRVIWSDGNSEKTIFTNKVNQDSTTTGIAYTRDTGKNKEVLKIPVIGSRYTWKVAAMTQGGGVFATSPSDTPSFYCTGNVEPGQSCTEKFDCKDDASGAWYGICDEKKCVQYGTETKQPLGGQSTPSQPSPAPTAPPVRVDPTQPRQPQAPPPVGGNTPQQPVGGNTPPATSGGNTCEVPANLRHDSFSQDLQHPEWVFVILRWSEGQGKTTETYDMTVTDGNTSTTNVVSALGNRGSCSANTDDVCVQNWDGNRFTVRAKKGGKYIWKITAKGASCSSKTVSAEFTVSQDGVVDNAPPQGSGNQPGTPGIPGATCTYTDPQDGLCYAGKDAVGHNVSGCIWIGGPVACPTNPTLPQGAAPTTAQPVCDAASITMRAVYEGKTTNGDTRVRFNVTSTNVSNLVNIGSTFTPNAINTTCNGLVTISGQVCTFSKDSQAGKWTYSWNSSACVKTVDFRINTNDQVVITDASQARVSPTATIAPSATPTPCPTRTPTPVPTRSSNPLQVGELVIIPTGTSQPCVL